MYCFRCWLYPADNVRSVFLSLSRSAFPCWLHCQARLPQAVAETATSCSGFIYLGSKKRKSPLWFQLSATLMGLVLDCYLKTQVHEPEAQWGQTILKHQSLEQERFITGPCKMRGSCLKNPKLPKSFQQSPFTGKVREGHSELLQTSWCQIVCSWSQVMVK